MFFSYIHIVGIHGESVKFLGYLPPMIQSGKILFPENGAEELITQLVGFGVEKHDDLVDAFSSVIISIMDNPIITKFIGVFH